MTTIVLRSKKQDGELDVTNPLHRMQLSIPWPLDAISAIREHHSEPWQFFKISDLLRDKRKRMENRLWMKREDHTVHRICLYVWVFWCPGIFGFAFRGWWTYLIGQGISEGKFLGHKMKMRLMELFPLVEPTLFESGSYEQWQIEFVKRYQKGSHCGKPQGKSPLWAEVTGKSIEKLLERTEWPEKLE